MINSDKLYDVIKNSSSHKFVVFPMTRPDCDYKHLCYKVERDLFPFCSISTSNKINIKISMLTCMSRISPNNNRLSIIHTFNKFMHLNMYLPIHDVHLYLY